ncbi:MAG: gliding motility-associated C-terminal domain-containing protein [Bacteroidales bacterium]|nr:gliding motility-associated C-terminal domain-containing protein [Bacteroidales bacterium]
MIFRILFAALLVNTLQYSWSQEYKRADIWYFGRNAGIDFSSGEPVAIYDNALSSGGTSRAFIAMSDTNSNLLFYSNGLAIRNRNHQPIDNTYMPASYDVISFPVYGSDHEYYVFSAPNFYLGPLNAFYYGIVDMSLNGGLGGVSEPVHMSSVWDPDQKLTATRHKNKKDAWVVTRRITEEYYASILVTGDSVHTQPVLSPAPSFVEDTMWGVSQLNGQIRISYDNKYLINTNNGLDVQSDSSDRVEVCKFDDNTGVITYLYYFRIRDADDIWAPIGAEFSPDSKYLYISGFTDYSDIGFVFQFDMQHIEDSAAFLQSRILVGQDMRMFGMQLARDGKIYITLRPEGPGETPYLSVINDPWKQGTACNFQTQAVFLTPGAGTGMLTKIFPYYLFRFDYEGICEGETFYFDHWFVPDPVYIEWNFGDLASGANNTSGLPNPTHVFTDGGTYEVSVYVEYSNGRIEETSRKIEVEYKPEPDLGPDTSICNGGEILLDAECGPHIYSWSNGAFGTNQITVADSGWYWVRVENEAGCYALDFVHISFHNTAFADTANMIISPTTCGGSTGAIKGLVINGTPPLAYRWLDDMGNAISSSPDIYHLPVGNYTLEVTDNNGCINYFGPYTIHDAGEVLIEEVHFSQEYCDQQDASITVTAVSGLGDMLFYSIDNGANYYANQGIFTGLSAGSYAVRVKDSSDCQDVYINNPLMIENMDAPEIVDVQTGACTSGQSNGSIAITAIGGGDTLYYSNDNGVTFQVNDGGFYNLLAGFYTCVVMDEVGCDTNFVVEVPEEITLRLQAVAGDDEVCPGNAAFVPLYVSNFNDVAYFKTTLLYDRTLLTCTGFANPHAQIEDSLEVMLFPAEGRVELLWHAPAVILPDNTALTDLVFESLDPGLSTVDWDGSAGASLFLNSTGLTIPVDYYLGSVRIYQEVLFSIGSAVEACQGDDIEISPVLLSGNGEVSYIWTDPSGAVSSNGILSISNAQTSHSGTWTLKVSDTLDCYSEESVEILVHPNPVPAFAGQDTITTEDPLEIDAGDGFSSYLWNNGETNQVITAELEDWYSVMIESLYGCTGRDSVYVKFIAAPPPEPIADMIQVPNAFTPDNDGLNDEFRVINPPDNLTSFNMYIFNRWGQLVFESGEISPGWDGTYQNQPAPAGTYVYRIKYAIHGVDFDASGVVLLVR